MDSKKLQAIAFELLTYLAIEEAQYRRNHRAVKESEMARLFGHSRQVRHEIGKQLAILNPLPRVCVLAGRNHPEEGGGMV